MSDEATPRVIREADAIAAAYVAAHPRPEPPIAVPNTGVSNTVESSAGVGADTAGNTPLDVTPRHNPEEDLLFGLVTKEADHFYTVAELARETSLAPDVVEATLHRFVDQGVMRALSPEETGEEEIFFETYYDYLTFDALKQGDFEILWNMAEAGDKRAEQAYMELVAEDEARPPLAKAQDELQLAFFNLQSTGAGPEYRDKLAIVRMQVRQALDYIDQGLAEFRD